MGQAEPSGKPVYATTDVTHPPAPSLGREGETHAAFFCGAR